MKKVVIIGAGPAGLFAAYKLAGKCDVTILDKGLPVEKRHCPSPNNCKRKCKLCAKLYGEGGAGLMSDGKIIFSTEIGSFLNNVDGVGEERNKGLVAEVQEIFGRYDVQINPLSEEINSKISGLEKACAAEGIRYVPTILAHVGTDKLEELIINFRNELIEKGVRFVPKSDVKNIHVENSGRIIVETKREYSFYEKAKNTLRRIFLRKNDDAYECDNLIMAPGRVGAKWLEGIVHKLGIEYTYNAMDLGVRVEVKRDKTDRITEVCRDMKFQMRTSTYNDLVRTFCTCPGGKVAIEAHEEGYNLVNGHSEKGDPYENTNFAFLVTIPFTSPMANGNEYARMIAAAVKELGGGKPILQQLGDLRTGHRSKKERINDFKVKPSLEGITFGDVGLALPHRIVLDIIEGLEKLDKIIPGVANDETLLYAPEAKFHALRIKNSDGYLQTSIPGIYVAGDGAGLSRGIVGAAACGVLAAEGILRED
ncbi:MAG: FAD-dependent oxidoreductase [Candidatus Nanoarchaeia archaeon]|nr:FAD-dependent oxidoreductase [Candidatus Nanoarchaeia archaeon]